VTEEKPAFIDIERPQDDAYFAMRDEALRRIAVAMGPDSVTGLPVTEDEPEPAAAERVTIERSMDEGETWETIESSLSSPAALALAGIEPGVAWCSPSRSWYRWPLPERAAEEEVTPVEISTDDGVTWKPMGWCGPLIISRLKGMGPGEVIVGKFSGNHYRFPVSAGVPPQAAPEEEKPELTQEAADPMAPFKYLVKARQVLVEGGWTVLGAEGLLSKMLPGGAK